MNTPLVSILIPTYNRPEYLRRAVESCLSQTYPHYEVVITDNSTNDDSEKLAAAWTSPRVRYSRNPGNIGPTASCNRAVSLAQGKYLKFLMDDDLLKPRCLELMAKVMEENSTAGIVTAPMDLIDENDRRIFPKFYGCRIMEYRYRYQVGDGLIARRTVLRDFLAGARRNDYPCTVPSGLMYRTEALRRTGPFTKEADFAGDLEKCMKIATEWDFYYIDEVLSSWRLMPVCHTATLHRTGLPIKVFYNLTRACLDDKNVREHFKDNWNQTVRDSLFFCSCRALLNGQAGLRSRDPKLILDVFKTIIKEDPHPTNWLRLPFFVFHQTWISIFPPKHPPARGSEAR
ncbi:MAG TPA: glycosyltransferase family 2 protein [Verrucomicrobiae bacterium]|jgi:glycosyltransferase involved in cell wall biosynthesis